MSTDIVAFAFQQEEPTTQSRMQTPCPWVRAVVSAHPARQDGASPESAQWHSARSPLPLRLCYHPVVTPIRRQYLEIKRRFPDTIVFFRLGDFYETFDDDARLCAAALDLVLTSRPLGKDLRVPMAGIPHHAVNGYLARLIAKGYRVAIAEQIGDPAAAKGLVERQVARVVTPGTVLGDELLAGPAANYLVAIAPGTEQVGLAAVELSTGEFFTMQCPPSVLSAELARLQPAEAIVPADSDIALPEGVTRSRAEPLAYEPDWAERRLCEQFGVASLDGFGCSTLPAAICAAAAALCYLEATQPAALAQLRNLHTLDPDDAVALDAHTRRNLELFEPSRERTKGGTLTAAIDRTRTAMGHRLLRARLSRPSRNNAEVSRRLDQIDAFVTDGMAREEVRERLGRIPDLERLTGRIVAGQASPRDLAGVRRALSEAVELGAMLTPASGLPRPEVAEQVLTLLCAGIADNPPVNATDGGVIRAGFNEELDVLRQTGTDARAVLVELERSERERTGIRSLKVGYNRVFGYYIEVSNTQAALVPDSYIRRQTLSGVERYVTPELQDHERRVLDAESRTAIVEEEVLRRITAQVVAAAPSLRRTAAVLAEIDTAAALADVAVEGNYCRPLVDDGDHIAITAGRHPVVEQMLPAGAFVPNDTSLTPDKHIVLLTGPNMAGKSTYLRQVALIVLLARAGSYVPAAAAHIGRVDRIFSRIGASDDLAGGASTFMVEMVETAQILNHATPHSLVILDEVGRGTSTYDGLSIARGVVEYLHNRREVAARTLFATHYHELTALAQSLPRIRNCTVSVSEQDGEVVFLHRIVDGGADRSYGIHVARLAGLPREVLNRAQELLTELEQSRSLPSRRTARRAPPPPEQLSLFVLNHPLVEELAALDVDAMTPLAALTTLHELQARARAAISMAAN